MAEFLRSYAALLWYRFYCNRIMRRPCPTLLFLLAFSLAACGEPKGASPALEVLRRRELRTLPSASGITASGNQFLVNADNAPFLYTLDSEGLLVDSLTLLHEDAGLHEIPKPMKSDYEAASVARFDGHEGLLLLGSGSMSPHRDSALLLGPQQRKASLRPFYEALIRSGIAAASINIEAAASHGSKLSLFNRGTNTMITVNSDSFLNALFAATPLPAFSLQQIHLPTVKGFNAGISGATMLNDSTLLFCGSVEATTDWARDGEVLGSGIGVLRVPEQGQAELLQWTMLERMPGKLLPEKLEGLEVLRRDGNAVILLCVTDNDNGTSGLLDIRLQLPSGISRR